MPGKVETVSLGDLKPDPRNARRHTARNVGLIENALQEVGAARSIVIDEAGTVLAGNATIEAAAHAGIERVRVVDTDGDTLVAVRRTGLTPAQKTRLALYDNRAAELADWDDGVLADLVAEMPEVAKGLWTDAELHALLAEAARVGDPDAEPQLDRAAELEAEWQTASGQLWALGEHRLLCADATVPQSYDRLFQGEQYALLITDPPYGVSYADKNAFLNAVGRGNRIQAPIANDHQSPAEMAQFWTAAFSCARALAAPGASYYVTGPQGGDLLLLLLSALKDAGFPLHHMLVWAKNNHVLGRCDYHYQHEPILYGWTDGAGHHFYGGHSETSLWSVDKPLKSDLHPTMKPVELYARAMRNNSQAGEIVADIFAGSGTAFIAAEQLERRCRGMEIDSKYVAVILQRYLDTTGNRPVLTEEVS